jgi:hypothetical protein
MNGWWWVPVGLFAWFAVAVAMGPLVGRVLRRSAQASQSVRFAVERTPKGGKSRHATGGLPERVWPAFRPRPEKQPMCVHKRGVTVVAGEVGFGAEHWLADLSGEYPHDVAIRRNGPQLPWAGGWLLIPQAGDDYRHLPHHRRHGTDLDHYQDQLVKQVILMRSWLRLVPPGTGLIIIIALGLAACGQAAAPKPAGRTTAPSSRPAPASTHATAPSAATQLAAFFAAAQQADNRLHQTAGLVNGNIGTTSMRFTPSTLAAIRALDNAPVARAVPAGLPPGLLRDVLVVYGDLASRTAAFRGIEMYGHSGLVLPIGSSEAQGILRGLRNGAPAAARFGSDIAAAQASAQQIPPVTIAAPDSRAAAELAVRVQAINLRNTGCGMMGGWAPTELETVSWQLGTTQHPDRYEGTIGGVRFQASYTPQHGWQITIYAC